MTSNFTQAPQAFKTEVIIKYPPGAVAIRILQKWEKVEVEEDMEEETPEYMVKEGEDQEYLVMAEAVDIARN